MSIFAVVVDGFVSSRFKSFIIVEERSRDVGTASSTVIECITVFGGMIKGRAAWAHFLNVIRTAPLEFPIFEGKLHFCSGIEGFLCFEEKVAPGFIIVRFAITRKVHGSSASFLKDIS